MPNTTTPSAPEPLLPEVLRLVTRWQGVALGVLPQPGTESGADGRLAVSAALRVAEGTERAWRSCWDRALSGGAEVVHLRRADMLGVATSAAETVEEIRRLAAEAGCDSPTLGELESLSRDLSGKLEYRSARWQTAEDLEDLAAESLVPSDEEFRAIRDSLPFPQGWLEEDEKPF